jgi:hypothetical protein
VSVRKIASSRDLLSFPTSSNSFFFIYSSGYVIVGVQ